MSDLKNMGVKITLDREREMIYNLNVYSACIDKYGKIDDIFHATENDIEVTIWMAIQMLNEGMEIWNEDHPDDKIPPLDEVKLRRRYIVGVNGIAEFQKKVQEAILKGLPEDKLKQVIELGEKMAAQRRLQSTQNGATMNRAQRRAKAKK